MAIMAMATQVRQYQSIIRSITATNISGASGVAANGNGSNGIASMRKMHGNTCTKMVSLPISISCIPLISRSTYNNNNGNNGHQSMSPLSSLSSFKVNGVIRQSNGRH